MGNFFLVSMVALQIGAVGAYLWQRAWNEAFYWIGALTINLAVYWRVTH